MSQWGGGELLLGRNFFEIFILSHNISWLNDGFVKLGLVLVQSVIYHCILGIKNNIKYYG